MAGIPKTGLQLLGRLARNNSKEWFHEHKAEYVALVQEPMLALLADLNKELKRFAPDYVVTRKAPLSRPNRDTRFSKDKSPYRSDISVVFPFRGLPKEESSGFFLRVHPGGAEIVAGTYMPGPDQLKKLRVHFDKHYGAFLELAEHVTLRRAFGSLAGESLKRIPRGFEPTHPAADLLRRTQWYVTKSYDVGKVTSPRFSDQVLSDFRTAAPMVRALDKALGNF